MEALNTSAPVWYTSSDCGFMRSAFLDIASIFGMSMLQRTDASLAMTTWIRLAESISIGPKYSLKVRHARGNELLRNSLARVYFIDRVILREDALSTMAEESHQSLGHALMALAQRDPDTCCAALETLDEILRTDSCNGLSIPLPLIVGPVHHVVLEATDPEVISKAQAVLADALENSPLKTEFFGLVSEEQVMSTLEALEDQCLQGPPSNMQSALRLIGHFIDFAYQQYPHHYTSVLEKIARYIRILRITIIDTNPFDTRFAAVQSVAALNHIWTLSSASKASVPLLLGLSFILHDLLNDDDDEIRDLAALATGALLRAQGQPQYTNTVPLLTDHHLATFFFSSRFSFSSDNASTALISTYLPSSLLRRLTNTPFPTPLFTTPFASTFAAEAKQDSSLFAREKQNLYQDAVLDAVLYSRVLAFLHPSFVSPSLRQNLKQWVLSALSHLAAKADAEIDGALGWSAKPEVFALGMRVLCAAEVVLRWERETGGWEERSEIVRALGRFAEVGENREVHGLWMQRVDRVLEEEVLDTLVKVKGSLSAMGYILV